MSATTEFDCIVIGAGVQGSFTAYQLARSSKTTLLLEQFVLPHSRGSSHGQTRIIRKAYEQYFYCHMMEECYKLWAQLEKETGVQLYRQTGHLVMGPENSRSYQMIKNTMQRNNAPMVLLNKENFSQHVPHVNLREGDGALVDVDGGIVYADRTLKTVQGQFLKLGGVIRDKETVTDIKPGPVVTVSTPAGVYRAKGLVITAGPWSNKVLAHIGLQLPLQVVKLNVCYWKEKVPGTYQLKNGFPCFSVTESPETKVLIYGFPSNEYPGLMKICFHAGKETDPDQRDLQTDRSDIDILKAYIARCFPGLVPEPVVVESCLYTLTPDYDFVLDYHPEHGNIVIGAGFSGHGFKFGPVVGKILRDLILGEMPSHDLSPFKISRFQGKTTSAL
ncbi:peroxisomal sarcosine oxidase [Brachionichthys hirsutus]|uniref:peroxisomal sarcosine oxidase n=1 Tax=Brachionichthys hirsutus TaxID=412623 RepID=UPI0036043872